MTTAKQIKQVFQPLMKQHGDLVHIGSNWLWIRPTHHVALRVLIDRTSDKNTCRPLWTMLSTFIPGKNLIDVIGYSGSLNCPSSSGGSYWSWLAPTMIADLISAIETDALPRLRAISSLEAFWTIYGDSDHRVTHQWPEDRMIFDIALGDIDAARVICETLEPKFRAYLESDPDPDDVWVRNRCRKVLTVAEPLRAGDRAALAQILHDWEAENIRGTKIEPYWEPTPFPLERALA